MGALVAWTQLHTEPSGSVENVTLEPVEWEFEKPFRSTDWPLWFTSPDEVYVTNSYAHDSSQITFTVIPCQYSVNDEPDGSSVFKIWVNITASIAEGYVEGVRIVFREDYNMSQVHLFGAYGSFVPQWYAWENLTMKSWAYCFYREWTLVGNEKAFIEAVGKDHPSQARFSAKAVHWILKAPENVSQQLEATAEVTYFNGTSHIKAVLPILIRLVADAGDTFEAAGTVKAGGCRGYLSAFGEDLTDCYRVWLLDGQTVSLRVAFRNVSNLNLTLYDPNGNPRASVSSERYYDDEAYFMELTSTINTGGYWYIEVSAGFDNGTYLLTVGVGGRVTAQP